MKIYKILYNIDSNQSWFLKLKFSISSVSIVRKKMISIVLLFCVLSTILHSHSHLHHPQEKISLQIVEGQYGEHHFFSNDCEKCLTKNNKSEVKLTTEKVFETSSILIACKFGNYTKYYVPFKLYSRPPPIATA